MKVLQVIDKLDVGGAERVLVDLSNILDENKLDVTVLCLLNESVLDKKLNETINRIYLKRSNKFNILKLFKLYNVLKKYDIIHVHSRHILRYVGLIIFLPVYLRPFKIIFHDHSLLNVGNKSFGDKLLTFLLKKIDGIIMVCDDQKNFYPDNSTVFLLENIVRDNKSADVSIEKSKRLVAIGNFRRIKNYELMLEILESLPVDYQLDIYVNGIDKKYCEENSLAIEKLVKNNQLNIIIGEVDLQAKLASYSLAIHTSLSESGPLVAIEYLSVGLPLIMYNTGAVAKKIKKKLPYLIKENTNKEEWIKTILKICSNYDIQQFYSKEVHTIFKEEYSEEKYNKTCQKIYQNIISS